MGNLVINAGVLNDIYKTFTALFSKGMQAAGEVSEKFLAVKDIAMEMNVTGGATTHSWLAQIKGMTEWVGPRVLKMLEIGQMTVINRDFEDTVVVPANAIKDDQVGVYAPLVQNLGQVSEEIWADLMGEAVSGNAAWADGNPFFCSNRKLGDSVITNATTNALSAANVELAIASLEGFTLHGGRKAKVRAKMLVVGPSQEAAANAIVKATIVKDGDVSVSNTSTAMSLMVKVCDDFVGTKAAHWMVVGSKANIELVCVQKREIPTLTRMDDPQSANAFMLNEYYYGTSARGEAFLTLPFLAVKGGLATVTAWSEDAADAVFNANAA